MSDNDVTRLVLTLSDCNVYAGVCAVYTGRSRTWL